MTLNQSFVPFKPTQEQEAKPTPKPALYLGFVTPANGSFSNRPLSLFFFIVDIVYGEELDNPTPSGSPQLSWQYWDGKEWQQLTIRDETENFTRSGLIEFLPPGDFAPREDFNLPPRYWLRVKWLKGDYDVEPRLKQVLLNTTMAAQTATIQKEIVGSSDGTENQTFQTTSQPILAGQELEVREPEIPSALEKEKILLEEGEKA
ncbi:hypothetical protein, partial [Moorena sp. SIO3I8]|uniref:hypothetical protein n=1 Tax=Moorena sp. SIO3I8 TaxID=2607833 RepID=UPI0013BEF64B